MFFFRYTKKKLAQEIITILNEFLDNPSCEYKADTQEIFYLSRPDNTEPNIIFLGNIFNKVKHLKKNERLDTLRKTIGAAVGDERYVPEDFINSLMLRARTPFEISLRSIKFDHILDKLGQWVVYGSGDILLELTSDNTETVQLATATDLEKHEILSDEAYKIAAAKLHRSTDQNQWQQIDDTTWISSYDDDYDFARLLVNPEINRFPFEGAPIIYAPSHSVCLITNSMSENVLKRVIDIGNKLSQDHRQLSQYLWTFDDSHNCIPWQPAKDTSGYGLAKLQILRELVSQYNDQQNSLNKKYQEEKRTDYFVASFNGYQNDDDCQSNCVYSIDIPTSLPKTDFVGIFDPEEQDENNRLWGMMPWQTFQEIIGSKLVQQDHVVPPRFELLAKISDEERKALRAKVN